MNPRALSLGIDQPNCWHSKLQVVVDLVLHIGGAVCGRKYLDSNFRRCRDYATIRTAAANDDNLRHTKSIRPDLDADLYARPESARLKQDKRVRSPLRIAMSDLAHISLHQAAFDVFAIRIRSVTQIFNERNHNRILAAEQRHPPAII